MGDQVEMHDWRKALDPQAIVPKMGKEQQTGHCGGGDELAEGREQMFRETHILDNGGGERRRGGGGGRHFWEINSKNIKDLWRIIRIYFKGFFKN